jgi:MYXO-CTERM domain-containing protein
MRKEHLIVGAMWLGLGLATAKANLETYNFEGPKFTNNQSTPFSNLSPNIGDASFLASFTSSPDAGGLQITNLAQNGLMQNQALSVADPASPETLTISLSQPVYSVSLDFAVLTSTGSGPGGYLQLTSPVGSSTLEGADVGGGNGYPGGLLTFNSATPFSSFSLEGFDDTVSPTAQTAFQIDNLVLNTSPVPEPRSAGLTGAGLVLLLGYFGLRRRANHQTFSYLHSK